MKQIFSSLACNLDTNILAATFPLFQEEKVEAIEWSFDTLFGMGPMPKWFEQLLHAYSDADRLIGHGVFFSLFKGRWSSDQQKWLDNLRHLSNTFQFDHITEHFGFMTGENFHHGAPLNVPFTKSTLAIGRDRLARIQDAANCPVGIENLAFAYHPDEVKRHGEFLLKLIEPVNGFIILDLHNLYCQLMNFDLAFEDLIHLYPLDRVREIHISGGSWEPSELVPERNVRRDTHDAQVPENVFELLEKALLICPNVKFVVMEQLGTGLYTKKDHELFRDDFERMKKIVDRSEIHLAKKPSQDLELNFSSLIYQLTEKPISDETLHQQQIDLSMILENAKDHDTACSLLKHSTLANTAWEVERWTPYMLETAVKIAQKWSSARS